MLTYPIFINIRIESTVQNKIAHSREDYFYFKMII